jgi:ABC-2 type transport system ATP-binding protein
VGLLLENISHRFGRQEALRDVTLRVERGDCYGFIGHNGAGKTTAIRIALGLVRPRRGRVLVDGFDAAGWPREARARMGALVETPGFHAHWSGPRNLVHLARLQGMPRAAAQAEASRLMDLVGLPDARGKPVRAYSQGMRQRLGVAQALLGTPPYVLLDEPTNGLDPEGVAEMRVLLRRLGGEGVTILISSHQLHELSDLCTRVGVLRQGRLMAEERVDTLLYGESRRYHLRTDRDDAARELLAGLGASSRAAADGGLVVDVASCEPPRLVRALVEGGLEVRSFAPRPATLEEIYLRFHRAEEEPGPAPRPAPAPAQPPRERRAPGGAVARVLLHEARRWSGQLAVPCVLLLPALVGTAAVLHRKTQVSSDSAHVASGSLASATDVTAFEGVGRALSAGLPLAAFLLLAVASQSIAGELSQGTLRNVLLRPLRRAEAAVGKGLALVFFGLLSYALLVGAAMGASAAAFGFSDLSEILPNGRRYPLVAASELWPELQRALVAPLLPLAAYAGLGFLAGTVARRGASGLAIALGLGVLLDLSRAVARPFGVEPWLLPAHLPSPLGDSSFLDYYLLASQGVSNATFTAGVAHFAAPALWAATSFAAASWILSRRAVP